MKLLMGKKSFSKRENDVLFRLILVISFCLLFSRPTYAQTYKISCSDTPLSDVLINISKQYDIKVAFDHNKAASINISKEVTENSIELLLDNLLRGTDLSYEYKHSHYLISDKKEKQQSSVCQIIGILTDEESGEALPYANVIILNDYSYATTSANGFFSIKNIKVNPINLNISYIGYEQLDTTIIWTDKEINLDLCLKRNPYQLASIVINGSNNEVIGFRNNVNSSTTINTRKLIDLPTVTETDVFKALQLLPGVSYLEQSIGLSIRGGSSDQNLVLFDGQTLYNLSHYYGAISALNPNIIKDVQIFKGGYDVQYGDRVSGIIDITSKNGNRDKIKIYGDLNLLSANIAAEIPINDKISMIGAVRRSYSDIYATDLAQNISKKNMLQYINPQSSIITTAKPKYYFYDYNVKMTIKPKKYETYIFNMYGGKDYYKNAYSGTSDELTIDEEDKDIWSNYGLGGSWQRQWNESLYSDIQMGASGYFDKSNSITNIDKTNSPSHSSESLPYDINQFVKKGYNKINDMHLSSKFQYQISGNNQLDFGAMIRYNNVTYKKTASEIFSYENSKSSGTTTSAYLQDKIIVKDKLMIKPGVRINYYSGNKTTYIEPRLSVNYTPIEELSFKLSTGKYHQFTSQVSSVQETNYNNSFWVMTNNREHPVLESNHYIVGATFEKNKFLIDVESYYKNLSGLQEFVYISEYRSFADLNRFCSASTNEIMNIRPSSYITGTGKSYGIDILLKYSNKSFTSWISYSYGKSIYKFDAINYGEEFESPYDMPHQISWTNMYSIKKWNFSTNLLYTSGSTYITSNVYDDAFRNISRTFERLPDYYRLDLSTNYNMVIKGMKLKAGITLMNIFNTKNYYDVNIKTYDFSSNMFSQTTLVKSQSLGVNLFVHFEF